MGKRLRLPDDPMYHMLREGQITDFNTKKAAGGKVDLTSCDFRNTDLRGLEAEGLDFSNCYFRQADLRGVDFRGARLDGASLNGAKVSGTYFPASLTAEEISLSLVHGTRLRYRP